MSRIFYQDFPQKQSSISFPLWFYKVDNPVEPKEEKMDDSIRKYEEKLWQLFDITKNEMPGSDKFIYLSGSSDAVVVYFAF